MRSLAFAQRQLSTFTATYTNPYRAFSPRYNASSSFRAHCALSRASEQLASGYTPSATVMGKDGRTMQLGGHRGMGENLTSVGTDGKLGIYPAYRENTIQSFQQAAKCGVGFVEFDVQVTRDNVPIIWHDDQVIFGSVDQPNKPEVKDMTLEELQALCKDSSTATEGGNTALVPNAPPTPAKLLRLFRDRTTRQWATQYQPWSCSQDDTIPTLEAVFQSVPETIGFDIEVKMTTGDDIEHTPSDEVDRVLSAVLPVVERMSVSGQRNIVFSSFDPDVCLELRKRQTRYPVYYLSGCGLYQHVDGRRTSIPAAIDFARETGMRGICVPASIVMSNMDMVGDATKSALEVMTYGLENNDPVCLRAQADAGVVAAIVDEVAGVTATFAQQAPAA